MSKYSNEQYVSIFNKLPPDIKDVVLSYATVDALWAIGKRHNLQIDQTGKMIDITFDVVMGIVATKDFVKELTNELHISALDALAISRDVDDTILQPIKQTMIKTFGDSAPYKPSSSLVQVYEDEDDHPSLQKETILKEIEEPEAPIIKKEIVYTQSPVQVAQEKPKQPESPTSQKTDPLPSVYKEEIQSPQKESAPIKVPSFLEKITSLKLSQSIVMPKEESSVQTIIEKAPSVPTSITTYPPEIKETGKPEPQKQPQVQKDAPEEPSKQQTPQYSVDPYREQI